MLYCGSLDATMIWLRPKWQLSVLTAVGEKKGPAHVVCVHRNLAKSKGGKTCKTQKTKHFCGVRFNDLFQGYYQMPGKCLFAKLWSTGTNRHFFFPFPRFIIKNRSSRAGRSLWQAVVASFFMCCILTRGVLSAPACTCQHRSG